MTQQVFDAIRFAGLEYAVVGANGSGLFRVADHGFAPQTVCTACWRGAWLQYVSVAFTGGLLAARRMVQGRRYLARPTYSWDYEQVLELSFAAGRLELVLDHSAALKEFRARALGGTENEAVPPSVYRRSYDEMPDGPWMW